MIQRFTPPTITYKEPKMKICPECGEEKPYYNNRQKYCRECAQKRYRESQRQSEQRKKLNALHNKEQAIKRRQRKKIKESMKKYVYTGLTIDEVVKIAEQNKISYGKCVLILERNKQNENWLHTQK